MSQYELVFLAAPLQHTLRIRASEDGYELLSPDVPLTWTPLLVAGGSLDDTSRLREFMIVEDYGDIIRHYAKAPEEEWTVVAEIKGLGSANEWA